MSDEYTPDFHGINIPSIYLRPTVDSQERILNIQNNSFTIKEKVECLESVILNMDYKIDNLLQEIRDLKKS